MGDNVKFCTNCGKEIKANENFCTHCGKPVQEKGEASKKSAVKKESSFFSGLKEKIVHNKIVSGAIALVVLLVVVWLLFFNTPFSSVAGTWESEISEGTSGTVTIKRDGLITLTILEQSDEMPMSIAMEGQLQEGVQEDVFRTGYLTPTSMIVEKQAYDANYQEFAEVAYEIGVSFEEEGDLMVLDLTDSYYLTQELSQEMGMLSVYTINNNELVISDQYGEDPITFYK